jgi:hypothetical protein
MTKLWSRVATGSVFKNTLDKVLEDYGHFALYRRYNVGDKSEFYQDNTGDGDKGPKWTFKDEIIKIRHDPMSIRGAVGISVQTSKMAMSASVNPKRGDVVIEIKYAESDTDPSEHEMYTADHSEAFEITEIDPKRGYKGRIEFYIVQVVPHMGDY